MCGGGVVEMVTGENNYKMGKEKEECFIKKTGLNALIAAFLVINYNRNNTSPRLLQLCTLGKFIPKVGRDGVIEMHNIFPWIIKV